LATGTSLLALLCQRGELYLPLGLAPARFLVNTDTEHCLGHELARHKSVGWVNTPQACIAEEPLDQSLFEDTKPSCQVHGCIDDLPGTLDSVMLDGHEPGTPQHAVTNTV
jgi:hypothetical protein